MPDDPKHSPESENKTTAEWMKLTGLGMEFVAAIAVCAAGGYGIDRWLDTGPWLLICGVGLGFAVGLVQLIRGAQKIFHD